MRLLPARRLSHTITPLAAGTRVDVSLLRRDGVGAGWTNTLNGMGSLRDTSPWTSFGAGRRLDWWEVRDLLRSDGVAHRICYREAQDALREGFEPRGSVRGVPLENDPEQQKAWSAWLGKLGAPKKTIEARGLARADGGAAWVLWVDDGRRSDQPIDWSNIRDVLWLRVVRGGRSGLIQPLDKVQDPTSPRFLLPRAYNVSFPEGGAGVFHWHRVIIWQGSVIDEQELANNNGWGESVLDRVWTALSRFGQAHQYAVGALLRLAQPIFQSQYLASALEAGRGADAQRRLEDVCLGAGLYGAIGIGPNEDYKIAAGPTSSIDTLLEKFIEILVMYTDQPELVLRGKRPGGLSTSADGEFRGWYDFVASQQGPEYTPQLVRLIDIGSRALRGPTGGIPVIDPDIHWPQLWQETEAERQDNRGKASAARKSDLEAGVITLDEARTDADLDEWYQLGSLQAPPEDEVALIGEVEAQPTDILQPGEQLMTIREAADLLGYRTTRSARMFASQVGALIRINPSTFRVARSLLMAGLREAQVSEPVDTQAVTA